MAKRGAIIRRVDGNQGAIVEALRAVGAVVQLTHTIGKGCPDCFITYSHGHIRLCMPLEIKMPGEKLTTDELDWWAKWNGPGAVVHSVEEALAVIRWS